MLDCLKITTLKKLEKDQTPLIIATGDVSVVFETELMEEDSPFRVEMVKLSVEEFERTPDWNGF